MYVPSTIPVAALNVIVIVLGNEDVLTLDPFTGKVTSRQRIAEITKVSWDRRNDELFRVVFRDDHAMMPIENVVHFEFGHSSLSIVSLFTYPRIVIQ